MSPINTQKPMGFWSAVSLGIGSMIGAGIFALLGEAALIAGNATYISFIIGGCIALISGYSLGKLGARYPSAGGIVEYLSQSFGNGMFTGSMSIMLYVAAIISLSLIAKAFGAYAATFLPSSVSVLGQHICTVAIVALFVGINLRGSKDVAFWERITVALKFTILLIIAITGILYMNPAQLEWSAQPPMKNILFSLSITFFAYEGFRVITNAAEDMPNPTHTLPRAIMTSILLVMLLYVAISLAVFGNLSVSEIVAAKDYALAEAAKPLFGTIGFTIVAITALISTASSINANLYAVTNVTYQLAKNGELPSAFGRPIAYSREGLIFSGVFVIILSLLFNLSQIAAIGSISLLFIHGVTHIGHLRIIKETGASIIATSIAAVISFLAMFIALYFAQQSSKLIPMTLLCFICIAFLTEFILQKWLGRTVHSRLKD